MASHVVVISTDLRRTTVKVTPSTYLSDVLQAACTKLGLPGDKYLMKHKQKQVDLAIPFRTSGLSPGAKLELVQKSNTPSAVQVCLQIPQPEAKDIPGGRLVRKFPSDLSLWQVLRQFESGDASAGRNVNITARGVARTEGGAAGSGQLYYETPVLNIMGRELSTFVDFQKTLSQLGYNSGNVLLRLSYKVTDQTLYEAMEQIGKAFKDTQEQTEKAAAPSQAPPAPEPQPQQTEDAQPPVPQQADPTTPAPEEESTSQPEPEVTSTADPYAPVNVFLAPSGTVPAAALAAVSETDYTPTVAHAQLHQARLLEHSKNKRLLSDRELAEKAAAEEAKMSAVKSLLVRIRFPDNTSSEWEVGPSETGAFLYQAVRHVMASPDQPFRLVLPGGGPVVKDSSSSPSDSLVRGYKLSRRVLITAVWDDSVGADIRKQPFLKSSVANQAQSVKVPEVPKDEDDDMPDAAPAPPKSKEEKKSSDGGAKKVPKWFKIGKK